MTEVKFYHNAPDRLRAACAITGKAVRQGRRIYVLAPDESLARRYDHMLWTAQALSFIPHVVQGSPLASRTPVVIGRDVAAAGHNDVLLNLSDSEPGGLEQFALVVEIVSQDPADRQTARQRWQFYKERGYPIAAYDLAKPADS